MLTTEIRFQKLLTAGKEALEKIDAILEGTAKNDNQLPTDRRLLNMTEAAEVLHLSRPTIWRMCRDGELEFIEIREGTRRVPSQAITDFLNRKRRAS
jgi:excisionase family DNA binding protein